MRCRFPPKHLFLSEVNKFSDKKSPLFPKLKRNAYIIGNLKVILWGQKQPMGTIAMLWSMMMN